jgi:hypothetical protein
MLLPTRLGPWLVDSAVPSLKENMLKMLTPELKHDFPSLLLRDAFPINPQVLSYLFHPVVIVANKNVVSEYPYKNDKDKRTEIKVESIAEQSGYKERDINDDEKHPHRSWQPKSKTIPMGTNSNPLSWHLSLP